MDRGPSSQKKVAPASDADGVERSCAPQKHHRFLRSPFSCNYSWRVRREHPCFWSGRRMVLGRRIARAGAQDVPGSSVNGPQLSGLTGGGMVAETKTFPPLTNPFSACEIDVETATMPPYPFMFHYRLSNKPNTVSAYRLRILERLVVTSV
jgi:hypothetical protein